MQEKTEFDIIADQEDKNIIKEENKNDENIKNDKTDKKTKIKRLGSVS